MNKAERNQNEREVFKGSAYSSAWDQLVSPFFDRKERELFDAFVDSKSTDKDGLFDLKLQLNALNSLREEFVYHIETGQMANQKLKEKKEKKNER